MTLPTDPPRRRLFTSAIHLIAARFSQPVLTFLLFTAAARYLQLEELGAYLVLMGFMFFLQAASMLGLGPLLTREISQDLPGVRTWLGTLLILCLPFSLLVWAIFPMAMSLLGYTSVTVKGAAVLGAALPFTVVLQSAEAVFLSRGQALPLSLPSLLEGLIRLAVSLIFLRLGYGLISLMWAFLIGRIIGFGFVVMFLGPVIPRKGSIWNRRMAGVLLRGVPVFGAMFIFSVAFFRMDVVLVSLLMGEQDAGLYGAGYRFAALLLLLPDGVTAVLFPVLSRMAVNGEDRLGAMVRDCLRFLLSLEVPLVLFVMAVSGILLPLVFGPKFIPSAFLAAMLSVMVLPYSINGLLGFLLQAARQEKTALVLVITGVVFHAGAIVAGSAWGGLLGVAWSVLISMAMFSAICIMVVQRRITPLFMAKPLLKIGAAFTVGVVLIFIVFKNHTLIGAVLAPLAALVVLGMTGMLAPGEIIAFYRSLRNRKKEV